MSSKGKSVETLDGFRINQLVRVVGADIQHFTPGILYRIAELRDGWMVSRNSKPISRCRVIPAWFPTIDQNEKIMTENKNGRSQILNLSCCRAVTLPELINLKLSIDEIIEIEVNRGLNHG